MSLVSFYTPWKHQNSSDFLLFSGGNIKGPVAWISLYLKSPRIVTLVNFQSSILKVTLPHEYLSLFKIVQKVPHHVLRLTEGSNVTLIAGTEAPEGVL